MGVVINQGVKSSIVNYIGVAIGTFNLLWVYPKFLEPDEIGLIRILLDLSFVMAALSQIGAPNIIDRFFPYFRNYEKKHEGFFMVFMVYPLLGFLTISILYVLFKDTWISIYEERSDRVNDYFFQVLPLVFFIMYQNILEAYARVHLKIVLPGFVKEVFLRVWMLILILIYSLGLISFDAMILFIIGSYGIAVIILLFYIKKLSRLYLTIPTFLNNKELLKNMFTFGMFVFLGNASFILASRIDVLMIGSFEGLALTGVFSIAFFIGSVIEIPKRALSQITVPLISQAWKENDIEKIEELYKKSSLNQLIISLLVFLLIWLNIDLVFSLMPNTETYIVGKYVVLFIGLAKVVDMATGVNTEIILNSRFYRFNLALTLLLGLLMIGTNYVFIPKFGITGAAVATFLSMIVFNLIKYLFLLMKIKIQPFSKETLVVLLFGGSTYLILEFLFPNLSEELPIIINIGLRSGFILMLFLGGCYLFKISLEINSIIDNSIKYINRKNRE
ncbi:MAG: polysaccharide biosynthesis C-terminal domain-containing protein [Cytophagaceae bacterium]